MFCILNVIEGPATGTKWVLSDDQRVVVGRKSSADFPIDDDRHLSRHHFAVEGSNGSFRITDTGSSNGTFVNGIAIQTALLCSDDLIRAGKSLFKIELKKKSSGIELPMESDSPGDNTQIAEVPSRTMITEYVETGSLNRPSEPLGSPAKLQSGGQINGEDTTLCSPMGDLQEMFLLDRFFNISRPSELIWRLSLPLDLEGLTELLQSIVRLRLCQTLIVNQRQVERVGMAAIRASLLNRELSGFAETDTLIKIETRREAPVISAFRAGLGRDAVILIVSNNPPTESWNEVAKEVVSYPSLLLDVIQDSKSYVRKLTQDVEFLLFETGPDGELCILPSENLRDKMRLFKASAT